MWLSAKEQSIHSQVLMEGRYKAPLNWYEYSPYFENEPLPCILSQNHVLLHTFCMVCTLQEYTDSPRYKAAIANIDVPNWSQIPAESLIIRQPVVFINGQLDPITRPEAASVAAEEGQKQGTLLDVQVKFLDAGHWLQLEQKQEVSNILIKLAQGLPS
jgi:soluble epoxide hydrolase/lipid-phosphate phosphatase